MENSDLKLLISNIDKKVLVTALAVGNTGVFSKMMVALVVRN